METFNEEVLRRSYAGLKVTLLACVALGVFAFARTVGLRKLSVSRKKTASSSLFPKVQPMMEASGGSAKPCSTDAELGLSFGDGLNWQFIPDFDPQYIASQTPMNNPRVMRRQKQTSYAQPYSYKQQQQQQQQQPALPVQICSPSVSPSFSEYNADTWVVPQEFPQLDLSLLPDDYLVDDPLHSPEMGVPGLKGGYQMNEYPSPVFNSPPSVKSPPHVPSPSESGGSPASSTSSSQFTCTACGAEFRIKGYLTRHMKKHAVEKAYTCPFYDPHNEHPCHTTGGFSRRDTYKTHLKARHFLYPPHTPLVERSNVSGRCGGCFEDFESNEAWIENHIQKKACPALFSK